MTDKRKPGGAASAGPSNKSGCDCLHCTAHAGPSLFESSEHKFTDGPVTFRRRNSDGEIFPNIYDHHASYVEVFSALYRNGWVPVLHRLEELVSE